MGVKERAGCAFADGEIHILRQLAGQTCQLDRVQPTDHDANDMAGLIKDWPTTVSRLDRRGDLDLAAVVSRAGERADGARRDVASSSGSAGDIQTGAVLRGGVFLLVGHSVPERGCAVRTTCPSPGHKVTNSRTCAPMT